MRIKIVELNDEEIKEIYAKHMVNDFPISEVKPLEVILQGKKLGHYECFGMYEDNALMAYAFMANADNKTAVLLDYLAVISDARGKGYGTRMLRELKKHYLDKCETKVLIIEAESIKSSKNDAEKQIRERRIRFYRNNDLLEQDYFSVVFGTEFSILYLFIDEYVEDKDLIKDVYSEIYHAILEDSVYEKNIFIR